MNWFTHYTRPPRRTLPPAGRNHLKKSRTRTLCGLPLEPWLRNRTLIMDVQSRRPAYPHCKRCERLAVDGLPAIPPHEIAPAWPVLSP